MPKSISARDLAARLTAGESIYLLDVREPEERAVAAIEPSRLIPLRELPVHLADIQPPSDAPIVVYCHHGVRSLKAAAFLEQSGFPPVLSLAGGIEAWSLEVDPKVPRY